MSKYKIGIAEDHAIVREGLRALLESEQEIEVVCEAKDGLELIQYVTTHVLDLVLLDLSMPKMSGFDSMLEIKKHFPKLKILVVTMHDAEEYIQAALEAGANGYILKTSSRSEFILAVKEVLAGSFYISPKASEKLTKGGGRTNQAPFFSRHVETLVS